MTGPTKNPHMADRRLASARTMLEMVPLLRTVVEWPAAASQGKYPSTVRGAVMRHMLCERG